MSIVQCCKCGCVSVAAPLRRMNHKHDDKDNNSSQPKSKTNFSTSENLCNCNVCNALEDQDKEVRDNEEQLCSPIAKNMKTNEKNGYDEIESALTLLLSKKSLVLKNGTTFIECVELADQNEILLKCKKCLASFVIKMAKNNFVTMTPVKLLKDSQVFSNPCNNDNGKALNKISSFIQNWDKMQKISINAANRSNSLKETRMVRGTDDFLLNFVDPDIDFMFSARDNQKS